MKLPTKNAPQFLQDFESWMVSDPKKARKILELVNATTADPFKGIGHPEPLRHREPGTWSRRIDKGNRLVYQVEDGTIFFLTCRGHYE